MHSFQVFYCHHRTGRAIAAHDPAPMPLEHIAALAGDVLSEDGDFLGLVDRSDCVLQFMVVKRCEDDQRPIRMEMPESNLRDCHIRHISNAELLLLLENLPEKLTTDLLHMSAPTP